MVELLLFLIALLALAVLVYRKGPSPIEGSNPLAVWLIRCAFVLIALYIAFFLFFAVGELYSGDLSGIGRLVPTFLVAGIAILANKRPVEGGIILIGLSFLLSIYLAFPTNSGNFVFPSAVLIVGLPLLFAGALFLTAAVISQPKNNPNSNGD